MPSSVDKIFKVLKKQNIQMGGVMTQKLSRDPKPKI